MPGKRRGLRSALLMDTGTRERTHAYILARHRHPAWHLLASRRAPLVLSCLQGLFESDQARQDLADVLAEHAGQSDFEVDGDPAALARRELREWIRRALIVEREGRLYATDALDSALRFVAALDGRIMTSTASRLAVVQREIERLAARLNPDPTQRADHLREQIARLQAELDAVEQGKVDVASEDEAAEGMRELFLLATSLRADFRRVDDSWREADLRLRHAIVNENQHRGAVVDSLLDGHDALLETAEGRVFHSFQQQLGREVELEAMKRRLRGILQHPAAGRALGVQQQADLRWLVMRLVKESSAVIRARARSERDVRSFLKTGLAAEHHRVGRLLNEVFKAAQKVDWSAVRVRRAPSPLPPVAIACAGLPLIERLRIKSLDQQARRELALQRKAGDLGSLDEDFWASLDALDRQALVADSLKVIRESPAPLSVSELAQKLPPSHDLESIAIWLGMAREAGCEVQADSEQFDVETRDARALRFRVPRIAFDAATFAEFNWEP
jgi:uncharacterized small protein (DUF1192 family)